jgi:enoyl-[acyl-carrier protein] reductase I
VFRELGADLALTYVNNKAKPFFEPLARALKAPIFLPLDFTQPGQLEPIMLALDLTPIEKLMRVSHSRAFVD